MLAHTVGSHCWRLINVGSHCRLESQFLVERDGTVSSSSFATAWSSASVASACTGRSNLTDLPDVLLVIADDLGIADLTYSRTMFDASAKPQIPTPNIDSLANSGTKFGSMYSHSSCTPARAALLTARYGFRAGITSPPNALNRTGLAVELQRGVQFWPAMMHQRGYYSKMIGTAHTSPHLFVRRHQC